MLGLFAAERMKLLRHRGTWTLAWIFPLTLIAFALLFTVIRLVQGEPAVPPKPETADDWVKDTAGLWAGPRHVIGLLTVCGLAGLAFGGEYGWNTWKLIAPHARRWQLMLAKYVTVIGVLTLSLILFGVVAVAIAALFGSAFGAGVPQGVTLQALLEVHGEGALMAVAPMLLTIALASASAILLRSAMAGTVVSAVITIGAEVAFNLAPLIERKIYVVLPSYHARNLVAWIRDGRALPQVLPDGLLSLDWQVSLATMAAWIVVPTALAVLAFQRQDLN